MSTLAGLPTPALVLDVDRVTRNCERMIDRAAALGVRLRPHLKTAKSADVARLATRGGANGITVSTVAEAEYFAAAGFKDITYAVGIAGHKIPLLAGIQKKHAARINLLTDNVAAVNDIARADSGAEFAMFIEIDSGGGRGGVDPAGADLLAIAQAISAAPNLTLAGVLTHAGHSYEAKSIDQIKKIAEDERRAVTTAAQRLRDAGFTVPCVSVGSTPTALCAESLVGVTEMRPGVYTLMDLDQVILGVCGVDDIAVSVLATVIGHNPRSKRMLIDAGGLALSKDISAKKHDASMGYGLVCPAEGGAPLNGMCVADVHQEHGFVATTGDYDEMVRRHPIGSRLRVLPNHACMMAAPYDRYHLVRGAKMAGTWLKSTGW